MDTSVVATSWIDTCLNTIQTSLGRIEFSKWFVLLQLLLLGICFFARLLCTFLTILSPNRFASDHRKAIYAVARYCYWFTVCFQILIWLFGNDAFFNTLAHADYLLAFSFAALSVISLLAACISMLFKRQGKRVFIAKSLSSSALMMMLMGTFIGAFSWLLLS